MFKSESNKRPLDTSCRIDESWNSTHLCNDPVNKGRDSHKDCITSGRSHHCITVLLTMSLHFGHHPLCSLELYVTMILREGGAKYNRMLSITF